MNLSFAGCGFLGIYHVGVACCFRKYAPHLLLDKISGASAGAIAACCLICDLPIGKLNKKNLSGYVKILENIIFKCLSSQVGESLKAILNNSGKIN